MTEPTPDLVRSPQEDLYAATEEIRANEFPAVPAELLTAVLRAEEANIDSRTTAAREVSRAIDAWISSQPADEADKADDQDSDNNAPST